MQKLTIRKRRRDRTNAYLDLAVKLVAVVTGCSQDMGAGPCRLLTENGAKMAVNERDAGLATEIDADFAGDCGRYMPTEQTGER